MFYRRLTASKTEHRVRHSLPWLPESPIRLINRETTVLNLGCGKMKTVACDLCGSSKTILLFALPDQQFPTVHNPSALWSAEMRAHLLEPKAEGEDLAAYYPKEFYDGPNRTDATVPNSDPRRDEHTEK